MNFVSMFGWVSSIKKLPANKEEVTFTNKSQDFKFTFDYSNDECEYEPLNVGECVGLKGSIINGKLEVERYQSFGETEKGDSNNEMNYCVFIGVAEELKRVEKTAVISKIKTYSEKKGACDEEIEMRVPDDILFKEGENIGFKKDDIIGVKGYISINENNEYYVEVERMQTFEDEKMTYEEYLESTPLEKDLENITDELDRENEKEYFKTLKVSVDREKE